jgi:hypothetical protein
VIGYVEHRTFDLRNSNIRSKISARRLIHPVVQRSHADRMIVMRENPSY